MRHTTRSLLLLALFLLLLFGPKITSAATYYIIKDPLNSGKIRYLQDAWPASDGSNGTSSWIREAINTLNASGNVFAISGGPDDEDGLTYNSELSQYVSAYPATSATNQTIRGAISTDPDADSHTGQVTFSGTTPTVTRTQHNLGGLHTGFDFSFIRFIDIPSSKGGIVTASSGSIHDCLFESAAGNPIWASSTAGQSLQIYKNKFLGSGQIKFDSLGESTIINFHHNIGTPGNVSTGGDTVYSTGSTILINGQSAGEVNIDNNVLTGAATSSIGYFGTITGGTVNIRNNIIMGNFSTTTSGVISLHSSHTGAFSSNYVVPAAGLPQSAYLSIGGLTDEENNIRTDAPGITHGSRTGFLTFSSDDYNPMGTGDSYDNYKKPLAAKLKAIGAKLVWPVQNMDTIGQSHWTSTIKPNLLEFVNNGHELAFHGRSHTYFTVSDVIKITMKGGTNGTVDVDRETHKIILHCSEGDLTVPASGNFEDKTVSSLVSEINASDYWSAVSATDVGPIYALGEILQDTGGPQAIDTGYQIVADRSTGSWDGATYTPPATGFFKSELYDGLEQFESALGLGSGYIRTFAYPGAVHDATAHTAVRVFDSGRLTSARTGNIDPSSDGQLSSYDLYGSAAFLGSSSDMLADTTPGDRTDDIKANTNALCAFIATTGAWVSLHAHYEGEITLEEWDIILAEVEKWKGLIDYTKSHSEVAAALREPPYTYDESTGKTKRGWSENSDYRLQSVSSAIDAGIDVGLTTDYADNPLYGLPDIGAYEYQPTRNMSSDDPQIGETIRVYGDGRFRNTADDTEATARLQVIPQGSVTTAWLDLEITLWEESHRRWTESSDTLGDTAVLHTVGDLLPHRSYTMKIDGVPAIDITGDTCTGGVCTADDQGEITFTYTGGYSEHTFDVDDVASDTEDQDDEQDLNIAKVRATSTQDSITITWKTDHNARSTVRYGINKNLGEKKEDADKEKTHKVTLKNLLPDTLYYFRVKAEDGDGNEDKSRIHSIRTKSVPAGRRVELNTNDAAPYETNATPDTCAGGCQSDNEAREEDTTADSQPEAGVIIQHEQQSVSPPKKEFRWWNPFSWF